MKIAVIGTGYVGLVSGTCYAETGNTVTCVDIDEKKVKKLQQGEIPIFERGLEEIFERNVKQERLFFTTSLAEGISWQEEPCQPKNPENKENPESVKIHQRCVKVKACPHYSC